MSMVTKDGLDPAHMCVSDSIGVQLFVFSIACFGVGFGDVSCYVYTFCFGIRSRLLTVHLSGKSCPLV